MKPNSAFTLLEMLAAMTVLAVIMLIVVQIINSTTRVVQNTRRMDADSEARLVFNRLALDFSRMLRRADLDFSTFKQPDHAADHAGNDRLAFYSETAGTFASAPAAADKSPVALVAWQVNRDTPNFLDDTIRAPELQRLSLGLGWEPDDDANRKSVVHLPLTLTGEWPDLFAADGEYQGDYKSIGHQVFRFEYTYLLKSSGTGARLSVTPWDTEAGHSAAAGLRDVAAIVVTIAVLDETSRKIVAEARYDRLIDFFPDAADGDTPAAMWNDILNQPNFSTDTGVPPPASSRIRIYERYFYLP
jgi:prepilin-type N-terminal cleavage/methylation domain-containing protein